MNAADLKEWLATPAALFALMMLASLLSGLQQVTVAQRGGNPMSFAEYLKHWPESAATLLGNIIAFVILIVTDQLNYASALGVGFGLNTISDLIRAGGRSAKLTEK